MIEKEAHIQRNTISEKGPRVNNQGKNDIDKGKGASITNPDFKSERKHSKTAAGSK